MCCSMNEWGGTRVPFRSKTYICNSRWRSHVYPPTDRDTPGCDVSRALVGSIFPAAVVLLARLFSPALALGSPVPQNVQKYGAQAETAPSSHPSIFVEDIFDRRLNSREIVLVDWDGHLANPAMEFRIDPPRDAVFPAGAILTADGGRLYFDEPSNAGSTGPSKSLSFTNQTAKTFYLSIFPDRDSVDEHYRLKVDFSDSAGTQSIIFVDIHVVDQDVGTAPAFEVHLDFSEDQSGFFIGSQERSIMHDAVNDWAYFIDDMQLDPVPAVSERTHIWDFPLAWTPGGGYHYVWNSFQYTGFLLYAYGIDTPEVRSGGEPSTFGFQHSGGNQLPLRRSGGVETEIKGNYNTLGWFLTSGDDDWWVTKNFGNEPNDYYSIARHEFGHALAFNSGYPNFVAAEGAGFFDDPAVVAYHGSPVPVDSDYDHFIGVVDRLSRRGIFGNEYGGSVPARRWLITKLDLLLVQAVGYPLRETSCLVPLTVVDDTLVPGQVQTSYSDSLEVEGGIPFYDWTLESGQFPPGLAIDRFTGLVSGIPLQSGMYYFSVKVVDYDLDSVIIQTSLSIQ